MVVANSVGSGQIASRGLSSHHVLVRTRRMSDSEPNSEVETITLQELLVRSAQTALNLQREDGSFPPGRNGVYNEPETPVRTTSHWLTTLSKVYEITGDKVFADAANNAADYLLSDEARPYGHTFYCREEKNKDKCDGLIGQAAPIRALAQAGETLDRPMLVESAKTLFNSHPFDENIGLWMKVEIDGTIHSFDRTLNHQVLFAAASSEIKSRIVRDRINFFLTKLDSVLATHRNGLIKHYIKPDIRKIIHCALRSHEYWPLIYNAIVFQYHTRSKERRQIERGYHPIIIAALGKLKTEFPHNEVWSKRSIERSLQFTRSNEYIEQIKKNEISHGSMTPAIDHALAQLTFSKIEIESIPELVQYDLNIGHSIEDTSDPLKQATQISAISELLRRTEHNYVIDISS